MGTLRIVPADAVEADLVFAPDEIVILAKTLSDITPVAGIISETFTSPLAHVSLRAKGWGIPNIGKKGAQAEHAELAGKPVLFEAKDAGYALRLATADEVAAAKAKRDEVKSIEIPVADLASQELESTDTMDKDDERRFGPKASNLGVIINAKLDGFSVPQGFGVPFHYFDAHLTANGLDKQLAALLADEDFANSASVRKTKLEAFRKAIETAPFDEALRDKIEEALAALPADRGVFVRSSTNAKSRQLLRRGPARYQAERAWPRRDRRGGEGGVASTWTCARTRPASTPGSTRQGVRRRADPDRGRGDGSGVVATVHPTDPTDERNYTFNAKSGLGSRSSTAARFPRP